MLLIIIAIFLCGCSAEPSQTLEDYRQRERQRVFTECLKNIPQGPKTVANSNDWSEVVDACGAAAYYQTMLTLPPREQEGK